MDGAVGKEGVNRWFVVVADVEGIIVVGIVGLLAVKAEVVG